MSQASARKSPTQEDIEVRAYEIYVERGSVPGNDVSDWLEAEAELNALAAVESDNASKFEGRLVDSKIEGPLATALRSRATVA